MRCDLVLEQDDLQPCTLIISCAGPFVVSASPAQQHWCLNRLGCAVVWQQQPIQIGGQLIHQARQWSGSMLLDQGRMPSDLVVLGLSIPSLSKRVRTAAVLAAVVVLGGCLTVRQEDLTSWVGQPVVELDTHPVFLTMPVVKTVTPQGIEIRNYVNGRNLASCSAGGFATNNGGFVNASTFNACTQNFAACNNIFYIKDGKIIEYAPTGSGGMRCFTNETLQPRRHFS